MVTSCRLFFLALLLCLGACGRNHPRSDDDIAIAVDLHRSWVRARAPVRDDFEISGGGSVSVDSVAEAMVVLGVVCIGFGIEYGLNAAPSTQVWICPAKRPDYEQRLYWGNNIVYLPADIDLSAVPLRIIVEGDRHLDEMHHLDLRGVDTVCFE